MIRVRLPAPLRELAQISGEVAVEMDGEVTQRSVLEALEAAHPELGGTIRDRATGRRRSHIRFFAGEEDVSHDPPDAPLPPAVAAGEEPFSIVGAMAGG